MYWLRISFEGKWRLLAQNCKLVFDTRHHCDLGFKKLVQMSSAFLFFFNQKNANAHRDMKTKWKQILARLLKSFSNANPSNFTAASLFYLPSYFPFEDLLMKQGDLLFRTMATVYIQDQTYPGAFGFTDFQVLRCFFFIKLPPYTPTANPMYDFWFCSYNPSVVVGYIERFSK
jgi:hypothetical protein